MPGIKVFFAYIKEFIKAVRFVRKHGSAAVLRDEGTELLTKAVFKEMALESLKSAMRSKMPVSLVMADMNGLREINSRLGHQKGDAHLKISARIFLDTLRESDIVGRYGGDEFIAILPGTDKNGTMVVVDKLRRELDRNKVPWSFGVAAARFPNKSELSGSARSYLKKRWTIFLEDLITEADEDLYRDKTKRAQ